MSEYLGFTAMIISVLASSIGLPMQIIKNYRRKDCEGLSLGLVIMTFLAYSIWSAYGFSKPDWFLAYSQLPGSALCFVILIQFYCYRTNRRLGNLRNF